MDGEGFYGSLLIKVVFFFKIYCFSILFYFNAINLFLKWLWVIGVIYIKFRFFLFKFNKVGRVNKKRVLSGVFEDVVWVRKYRGCAYKCGD